MWPKYSQWPWSKFISSDWTKAKGVWFHSYLPCRLYTERSFLYQMHLSLSLHIKSALSQKLETRSHPEHPTSLSAHLILPLILRIFIHSSIKTPQHYNLSNYPNINAIHWLGYCHQMHTAVWNLMETQTLSIWLCHGWDVGHHIRSGIYLHVCPVVCLI